MNAIQVVVPEFCFPEAKYSIDILFKLIQLTEYHIEADDSVTDFIISHPLRGPVLTIKNHFFVKGWSLNADQIPNQIGFTDFEFYGKKHELVELYGKAAFTNGVLDLDIVSSVFFMASRWEEVVLDYRDEHGRFDENHALAVKYNFIERPVINEYAYLLSTLLQSKGVALPLAAVPAFIQITFDIDYVYKWKYWKSIFGNLIRKGPSMSDKLSYLYSFFQAKVLKKYELDPFFAFDYILNKLKRYRLNAVFYFMVSKTSEKSDLNDYDVTDERIQQVFTKILSEDHRIGLHSSYHALESKDQLIKEKEILEKALKQTVDRIRPHFLRVLVPSGLNTINEAGFLQESSMLYPRHFGFRCGTTSPVYYYDLQRRETTGLLMVPVIAMSSIGISQDIKTQKGVIENLISKVKYWGGEVQIIWHNSDFDTEVKRSYFKQVLENLKS